MASTSHPQPETSKGVRTGQPLAGDHSPLPAEASELPIWFSLNLPAGDAIRGRQQVQSSWKVISVISYSHGGNI